MKSAHFVLAAGIATSLAAALIASPILAQRGGGDRPSRECIREIVQLCGTDRSQIPACLQENASNLSKKCQKEVATRFGDRAAQPQAAKTPFQRTAKPTQTVLYGNHQRQQIDVYEPADAVDPEPLILFVHGGGWVTGSHKRVQTKPVHFGANDIYFASTGYRVLPDAPVEDQAKDVGLAVQALVGQAEAIGFDPSRVVLMGHSAGAHLAALVATDPQYAGDAFGAIKGVVLLDGAGYDVAKNMKDAPFERKRVYEDAFGVLPDRQKALSPTTHVGGPDAPHWLALYDENRAIAKVQAELFTADLVKAGSAARAVSISGTDHGRMNRELGTEAGKAQTEAVDAFLAEVF